MGNLGLTMSMKNTIRQLALSQGAQLVAMASVEAYAEYLAEAEKRLQDTGAQLEDFMISPAANMPDSRNKTFFAHLADARKTLPEAKTIVILGVYAYDEAAIYRNTRRELRGKTARIYSYYPVARQIAESVVGFIEERGHKAVQGQHIPLKFVADRIGMGAYGKNGVLQTEKYGSYVALRNVLTDVELAPDHFERISTRCDKCGRCMKACPMGALYAPYKVNPKLCINPITRRQAYIEPHIRSRIQNWIHGCDICQEVCPANKNLNVRRIDPRARFDPCHHESHRHLDGLERTPDLLALISAKQPEIIRRNTAIALGNIGKGRHEALVALKEQLDGISSGLKEYFIWAIERIEQEGLLRPESP
ncbi:MAG: epoxyqueuosine reductase [Phycisphaerales bacterium]|nr:MAG: epoxyqueuosine reductase [Phycisphaerales bacterium]